MFRRFPLIGHRPTSACLCLVSPVQLPLVPIFPLLSHFMTIRNGVYTGRDIHSHRNVRKTYARRLTSRPLLEGCS